MRGNQLGYIRHMGEAWGQMCWGRQGVRGGNGAGGAGRGGNLTNYPQQISIRYSQSIVSSKPWKPRLHQLPAAAPSSAMQAGRTASRRISQGGNEAEVRQRRVGFQTRRVRSYARQSPRVRNHPNRGSRFALRAKRFKAGRRGDSPRRDQHGWRVGRRNPCTRSRRMHRMRRELSIAGASNVRIAKAICAERSVPRSKEGSGRRGSRVLCELQLPGGAANSTVYHQPS